MKLNWIPHFVRNDGEAGVKGLLNAVTTDE